MKPQSFIKGCTCETANLLLLDKYRSLRHSIFSKAARFIYFMQKEGELVAWLRRVPTSVGKAAIGFPQ